jgi:hypothetical protein
MVRAGLCPRRFPGRTWAPRVMGLIYRFPTVVPAKCWAVGCENAAGNHGLALFCDEHHAELPPPSDPSDVVRDIRRSTRWRMFWRRIKRGLGR